jgi:hypothetical protein
MHNRSGGNASGRATRSCKRKRTPPDPREGTPLSSDDVGAEVDSIAELVLDSAYRRSADAAMDRCRRTWAANRMRRLNFGAAAYLTQLQSS